MKKKYSIDVALIHYGVPGMRWGIRKDRQSSDRREVSSLLGKKAHELSDAELRKIANRLTLEQNYRRLNPSTMDKGKEFVGKILSGALKNVVSNKTEKALDITGKKVFDFAYEKAKLVKP